MNNKIKVIYIMGVGHSGSTMLDITLGNTYDKVNVGELNRYAQNRRKSTKFCACGELLRWCPFWSEVYKEWERQGSLYKAISVVSGKNIIVDSSKSPSYAMALNKIPTLDVQLVHLIRDGRGVVWSLLKQGKRGDIKQKPIYHSYIQAIFTWLLTNIKSEYVRRKKGGTFILYENFFDRLAGVGPLETGHCAAGNHVRRYGPLWIKPDYEWKELLPDHIKKTYWILAGWYARRYGYRKNI